MQQKLFQNLHSTRSGNFWKQHRKGTAKATPKIKNDNHIFINKQYLLFLQSSTSGNFLQKYTNFAEQRLRFSHFEGSIIP